MKIKAHKEKGEHKHKSSKNKSATEGEQLLPQKKLLSFTRTKDRKPRTSESKLTTGPDLEDFRDLIDEDEEPVPEEDELLGTGFPRRSKSHSHKRGLGSSQSLQAPHLEKKSSRRPSEQGERHSSPEPDKPEVVEPDGFKPVKTLPRLLAPRASIAETVAANRAASQTAIRNSVRDQILEHEVHEEAAAKTPTSEDIAEDEPLDGKKKKHSTIGHLWKVMKSDFLNPKAAAADIQAISLSAASMSVSAAKQAGSAMNSMATKMESEVSSLHDHILGGKRNLPDHSPSGKASRRSKKSIGNKKSASGGLEISVIASAPSSSLADSTTAEQSKTPRSPATPETKASEEESSSAASKLLSKAPEATAKPSSTVKSAAANDAAASDGLTVMKSKGSAYMLSQYEEEPESPGTLAEAITKTAEILTQKTGAVLSSANGGARYLRKIMMCGVGGRYKG